MYDILKTQEVPALGQPNVKSSNFEINEKVLPHSARGSLLWKVASRTPAHART